MALPGIFKKPITAYRDRLYKEKVQSKALTSPESLFTALKFLKPGSDLSLKGPRLSSGKRNWVDKYLDPHGGKAGATQGLRTFADLQKRHNTHPIAQQAARALAERLPQTNSPNQTVTYDTELYELAKRIAYPQGYEQELKIETPAPTVVAVPPSGNQAHATDTIDAKDPDFTTELDATMHLVQIATAIQRTNSEVSDSLVDGGRIPFAPTLLGNLPKPPEAAEDQDLSHLDKLNYYLDKTNLLDQVGEGDRHGLIEYRSELLKAEEKKQQAL